MPRPQSDQIPKIAQARAMEPPPAADIYTQASGYVGYHSQHKRRIARLDAIVNGNWGTVWPDGTVTENMPKVADFITSDMEDLTALIARPEPTTYVPPDSDKDADLKDATRRAHAIATYRFVNNRPEQRRRLAIDLVGTGLACEVIWPDYKTGYPRYMRKDPRWVYPDPDMLDPEELSSLVVAYRVKARILALAYPNVQVLASLFTDFEMRQGVDTTDIEVFELYDKDWSIKVAATPKKGTRNARTVQLAAIRNLVGSPLASIAQRTTFDGQLRGQFDKSIDPLGTANKMMEMKLAQLSDEIYAEKIVRGVFDNPDDIGPGATLYTTDYQASIARAETARASADFYNDMNLLLTQSREAGGVPQARHGSVDQSIISAQGINALQGKFATTVGEYQLKLANMERRSNSLAMAVDERYMDGEKPLVAAVGGRSFPGVYMPSKHFGGRYDNRVVYGATAGLDAYNQTLTAIQLATNGITSRRHARTQVPDVEDPIAMEAEIAREAMESAFLAAIQSGQGPPPLLVRTLALAADGSKSVFEISRILDREMQEAAAQSTTVEQALGLPPGAGAAVEEEAAGAGLAPLAQLTGGV